MSFIYHIPNLVLGIALMFPVIKLWIKSLDEYHKKNPK